MNNEFIVWDKDRKIWIEESYPFFINSTGLLCIRTNNGLMKIESDCEIFNPIGLKDTNGNKIYADSSIVEIIHIGKMSNTWTRKTCIVKFIYKYLQYRFIEIGSNTQGIELESMYHKLTGFKIIDTIQENKLGLIK